MTSRKLINLLFLLSFFSHPAVQAEGETLVFLDVFGGYSWGQSQDLEIDTIILGSPGSFDFEDVDVHNGPAFGGRVGMWLKSSPHLGVAFDVTRFDSDIDNQVATPTNIVSTPQTVGLTRGTSDVRITNSLVTADLIWRHRGSLFSPYVMAGPGIMISNMDGGFLLSDTKEDETDISFGFKVGAGVSYQISETMHIFTEYRYIHSSAEFDLEDAVDLGLRAQTPPVTSRVPGSIEMDFDAHVVVGGLSIRF